MDNCSANTCYILSFKCYFYFQWIAPDTLLSEYSPSKGLLAPPQEYEVHRLLHFQQVEDLHRFNWDRALKHRVRQYFPVLVGCEDGIIVVYPGQPTFSLSQFC